MKKKKKASSSSEASISVNSTPLPDYEQFIAVNTSVARVTITEIGAHDLPNDVVYKPMAYLKQSGTASYTFYAFIVVPEQSQIHTCRIHQINSINYVTLFVTPGDSEDPEKVFFMEITNMPAPIGFKLSSVDFLVTTDNPPQNSDGVTYPRIGKGKVAVDYQDADETM